MRKNIESRGNANASLFISSSLAHTRGIIYPRCMWRRGCVCFPPVVLVCCSSCTLTALTPMVFESNTLYSNKRGTEQRQQQQTAAFERTNERTTRHDTTRPLYIIFLRSRAWSTIQTNSNDNADLFPNTLVGAQFNPVEAVELVTTPQDYPVWTTSHPIMLPRYVPVQVRP